ncbi:MAG TPA: outer membrane beta-barrel protein [Steroidobacteraceae bacterium]|nr:outer membrane beta-barrel protein [Steroidobacteraceae bacterium]
MSKKIIALLVVCGAVSHPAAANEVGFYLGGYVGQATKEVPQTPFDELTDVLHQITVFTPQDEQVSLDDKDTAFTIFGGYRWNRYLAFEVGFTRLGSVTYTSRATGNYPFDTGFFNTTIESETSGFTVAALGAWPLTRDWELFAGGGALFATNQLKVSFRAEGTDFLPALGNGGSDSFSKSTTETYASLGVSRRILEIYDLRLTFLRVFSAGEEITGGKGDLDAAFLGLTVTF